MRHVYILLSLLLVTFLCGCDPHDGFGGNISQPNNAHVDFSDQTLAKFNATSSKLLFRYLAGNPRWEIREERGLRYAVRLERVDGKFKTTLNGFYSNNADGGWRQTRVLISFGKAYGFGYEHGNITRTKPGLNDVSLIIEGEHSGTPGNSSYTIIDGGLVFFEIYDQAPELARNFTQKAFNEVGAELRDVIKYHESIEKTGILPISKHYPKPLPKKRYFKISDCSQPGIYVVSAALKTTEPGLAYLKVFNVKTGARLSKKRMTPESICYPGWSNDGKTLFSYRSVVAFFEGDPSSTYEARFELWHRSNNGLEKKLAEKTRMINGWQR